MPGHFLRPDNCKDTFFAEHDALFKEFFLHLPIILHKGTDNHKFDHG